MMKTYIVSWYITRDCESREFGMTTLSAANPRAACRRILEERYGLEDVHIPLGARIRIEGVQDANGFRVDPSGMENM